MNERHDIGAGRLLDLPWNSTWHPRPAPCVSLTRALAIGPVLGALAAFAAPPGIAYAVGLPIQIDGDYDDWDASAVVATDPSGDDGSSGIDFTVLQMADDGERVFIRFDTTAEVQGDEGQSLVVAFDTDRNAGTGQWVHGVGAELIWQLGARTGNRYPGGAGVGHAEIGLVLAPTVSDVAMELALDRDASPGGSPLFGGPDVDVVVWDDAPGGDVIGVATYTFVDDTFPVTPIPLGRDDPDHVRIAAYNVENDGLFDGGSTEAAFDRLLSAADADVFVFCELWSYDAADVVDRMEEFLPPSGGESWYAVKRDAGNVVASRFPILDSWEILPGSRLTGVLVDLRPDTDSDLLVVANHWSCCTADGNRQMQADALIAFLRDARTPGGAITLVENTPIVAAGDFNLVGLRRQLETLITGDIADNGTFGPDSPPDWDGGDFAMTLARHPDARLVYTWRRDSSSFYPGKLDYVFFTSSVATLHKAVVFETRTMSPATLAANGLGADDTEIASDHAAIVADFTFGALLGAADPTGGAAHAPWGHLAPVRNPVHLGGSITSGLTLTGAATVDVAVFDTVGRRVASLLQGRLPPGTHALVWDGRDHAGHPVTPGLYYLRASREDTPAPIATKVVVLR